MLGLTDRFERTASALAGLLSLTLIAESALLVSFYVKHFPGFFSPVPFGDLNVDFLSLGIPRHWYVLGLHNEQIVATTRVLSAIDLLCLNGQYHLHQIASVSSLIV